MKVGDRVLREVSHTWAGRKSRCYIPRKYYIDKDELSDIVLHNTICGWGGVAERIIGTLEQDIEHGSQEHI